MSLLGSKAGTGSTLSSTLFDTLAQQGIGVGRSGGPRQSGGSSTDRDGDALPAALLSLDKRVNAIIKRVRDDGGGDIAS